MQVRSGANGVQPNHPPVALPVRYDAQDGEFCSQQPSAAAQGVSGADLTHDPAQTVTQSARPVRSLWCSFILFF